MLIDRNLYDKLSKWRRGDRPKYELVLDISCADHKLADATVRKFMYELDKEDEHGDCMTDFYSAKNFYRNMRTYFANVAELYRRPHAEDAAIEDIIKELPGTCGWITLIIEDMDEMADQPDELAELLESLLQFAAKWANIILIGTDQYRKLFADDEDESDDGDDSREGALEIGLFEQSGAPKLEPVTFEDEPEQRRELVFYWDLLLKQLKQNYFDYRAFQDLYRESWKYLIPRVTTDRVRRHDIPLIEQFRELKVPQQDMPSIDGCRPWELEAAKQFSIGLWNALVNAYDECDDFSAGSLGFHTRTDNPPVDYGAIYHTGCLYSYIIVTPEDLEYRMDLLAEAQRLSFYKKDELAAMKLTNRFDVDRDDPSLEEADSEIEETFGLLGALMDGIRDVADKTINKEPERKVRRFKGSSNPDIKQDSE